MHEWLWLSILVLLSWGALGVIQKVAVTHIPAENAFVWAAAGFMLLQPILFPTASVFSYSPKSIAWAMLNGAANALGLLSLLAAMRHGGKASVVEPLSALYPAFVVLLAPALLNERIRTLSGAGVACALIAGLLLSADKPSSAE
jgi:bacterial/archaeal transporter family protein